MISILERKSVSSLQTEFFKHQDGNKAGMAFTKLMELVDDTSPDDTIDGLEAKISKAIERFKQTYSEATILLRQSTISSRIQSY